MAGLRIQVQACSHYRGEQYPERFELGGQTREVLDILDRWISPERRYFKLRADDGGVYILCHDTDRGWELAMYDSDTRDADRLSST